MRITRSSVPPAGCEWQTSPREGQRCWKNRDLSYSRSPVHDGRRPSGDAAVVYVSDDADDLVPGPGAPDSNAFPYAARRIPTSRAPCSPTGPRPAGGQRRRSSEIPTGDQRRPERPEETRGNILRAAQRRDALRRTASSSAVTAMLFSNSDSIGSRRRERHRGDTGIRRFPRDVLLHPHDPVGLRHLGVRNREAHRLDRSGGAKPGCTFLKARNVRIISPDATSSTTAKADCTTTSACWERCRARLSASGSLRANPRDCLARKLQSRNEPKEQARRQRTASVNASTLGRSRSRTAGADSPGHRNEEARGRRRRAPIRTHRPRRQA